MTLSAAKIHKAAIANQADATVDDVLDLYETLVGGYISAGNMLAFVDLAIPIIKAGMNNAHEISASAYRRAARSEGASFEVPFPRMRTPNEEQIASSLKYLGFVEPMKRETGGVSFEVPIADPNPEMTISQLGGGVGRRVVQQSMDSMYHAVRADKTAIGWARITQGDDRVCYFCSMMETRGVVYTVESFIESDRRFRSHEMPVPIVEGELPAKAHDRCRCILTPVFSKQSDVHKNGEELYKKWLEVQNEYAEVARLFGWDMMHVWRLWWEGRIDDAIRKASAR